MSDVPANAAEHCPGTASDSAGKADACAGCPNQKICATTPKGPDPDIEAIKENLVGVRHKLLVLSGKGGVGKSTLTTQLARTLAEDECLDVGVLDVDFCGPSIPKMFGVDSERMHISQSGLTPVYTSNNDGDNDGDTVDNIAVVSIGFLLEDAKNAVIWRGDRKTGLLKQFLRDVHWDRCDYLLVDTPPGTSDEHLGLVQLCQPISGAIIITTPQEISWQDVRKEIDFCRKVQVPLLGLVINMSEFVCPSCSLPSEIFPDSGDTIEMWAKERGVPILARVPLDPRLGRALDSGQSFSCLYPDSAAAKAYKGLAGAVKEARP